MNVAPKPGQVARGRLEETANWQMRNKYRALRNVYIYKNIYMYISRHWMPVHITLPISRRRRRRRLQGRAISGEQRLDMKW